MPVSERGCVPLNKMDYNPHRKTLHNYAVLIASKKYIFITTSAIPNNCTRYTAEKSLISTMSLLCVISATHYEVISEISRDVEKEVRKTSIGVKKLYKVVTEIYGNLPVSPIHPELILSVDDTVNFIFGVKGSDNGRLV